MRSHPDYPGNCPGCGAEMRLTFGGPNRAFWGCTRYPHCTYSVTCHLGTTRPIGIPASWHVRQLRAACHAEFDPLWMGRNATMNRMEAYTWLAARMGLDASQTHFGLFGEAQCREAIGHIRTLRAGGGLATIAEAVRVKLGFYGEVAHG